MRIKIADTLINFENVERVTRYSLTSEDVFCIDKPIFCINVYFISGDTLVIEYNSEKARDYAFDMLSNTGERLIYDIDKHTKHDFDNVGIRVR